MGPPKKAGAKQPHRKSWPGGKSDRTSGGVASLGALPCRVILGGRNSPLTVFPVALSRYCITTGRTGPRGAFPFDLRPFPGSGVGLVWVALMACFRRFGGASPGAKKAVLWTLGNPRQNRGYHPATGTPKSSLVWNYWILFSRIRQSITQRNQGTRHAVLFYYKQVKGAGVGHAPLARRAPDPSPPFPPLSSGPSPARLRCPGVAACNTGKQVEVSPIGLDLSPLRTINNVISTLFFTV